MGSADDGRIDFRSGNSPAVAELILHIWELPFSARAQQNLAQEHCGMRISRGQSDLSQFSAEQRAQTRACVQKLRATEGAQARRDDRILIAGQLDFQMNFVPSREHSAMNHRSPHTLQSVGAQWNCPDGGPSRPRPSCERGRLPHANGAKPEM